MIFVAYTSRLDGILQPLMCGLGSDDLRGLGGIVCFRPRRGSTVATEIFIQIAGWQNEEKSFSCRSGHTAPRAEQKRGIE